MSEEASSSRIGRAPEAPRDTTLELLEISDGDSPPSPPVLDFEKPKWKLLKRYKPLSSQSRAIVHNVMKYFKLEYELFKDTDFKTHFTSILHRTSEATGVSRETVSRILNRVVKEGRSKTLMEYSNIKQEHRSFDAQFYGRIRDTINEMHLQNEVPMYGNLREKLGTETSIAGLAKILNQMGYVYVKTAAHGTAVVEPLQSRLKRIEYLEGLKKCRAEGKPIVYINEIFVSVMIERDLKPGKRLKPKTKGIPLIMSHVWNSNNAPDDFLIFYWEEVTDNYEKWLRTKLIINIPDKSAVVVPSKFHPNKYMKGYPDSTATTAEMKDWLNANAITVPDNLLKPQLYDVILKNSKCVSLDSGEAFLTDNGYILLEAPGYHWGLNPIEIIWPKLKINMEERTPMDVKNRLVEELDKINPGYWAYALKKVIETENKHLENEIAMDKVTDSLGIYSEINPDDEDWSSDDDV